MKQVLAKECTKCGAMKTLGEYHRRAESRDGRRSECKACHYVMSQPRDRRYYAENREAVLARRRRYYAKNRETHLASVRSNDEKKRHLNRISRQYAESSWKPWKPEEDEVVLNHRNSEAAAILGRTHMAVRNRRGKLNKQLQSTKDPS